MTETTTNPPRKNVQQSTVVDSPSPRLGTARAILLILWVVALVAALALAPFAFAATQADWQFNELTSSLGGLSFEALTAVITGIRAALAGLFLATAGLLLWRPPRAGSLLAASALIGLPFIFNLTGTAEATAYPQPWDTVLRGVVTLLGLMGIAALFLLLFLFPDGRFFPTRLRVPALLGLALTAAGIAYLQYDDTAWGVVMLAFLATILIGVAGQAWRFRSADPIRRNQTSVFLAAIVALPIWMLISVISISPLLSMAVGYLVMALFPIGLFIAARRGVWGEPPPGRVLVGATAALLVVATLAAGLWWRANRPQNVDLAALNPSGVPVPVLFDTDMAMDDIGALFYLLQHPGVDLRAITVNGVAFAHCDGGVHNVLGLLEVARAPRIPVSCGREESFPGGRPAPDEWRKSADNLYGAAVTTGQRHEDQRPAAELLAETIAAAPGEIVIVALGPLTNLAEAFQADPALAGQVKEIIIMGGAVDAPGNVSDADDANRVAEWNIFADPMAADIVLASGAPITLVPLDATNDVPFNRGFYQRLRANHLTRPAVFTYNLLYLNPWWLDGGMYWWDTLAAVAALDNSVVSLRDAKLDVVTEAGPEMGRIVESPDGSPARVAVAADKPRFEALFLAVLNHE